MKRVSKYHTYEKRDGGFLNRAIHEDRIVEGDELDKLIIENYKEMHNKV